MPSTSKKQHNFMAAVAHSPSFAKKVGVPMSVGKEFNQADKGRKFTKGGEMAESKAMMKKEVSFMKKKGAPKSMIKHEESEMKGMKKGGVAASKMGKVVAGGTKPHGEHTVQKKGHTKGTMITMAKGGKAGVKKMNYGGKAC
jgi:hypothetical protein